MKFSAAERTRPTLADALLAAALLLAAAALFFALRPQDENLLTAQVVLDNVVVAQLPLSQLSQTVTLDVPGAPYPITLEAQPGRIRVLHSDCPGQDCVHTGWVSRAGTQLICLPNRLVVTLVGDSLDADAVTG